VSSVAWVRGGAAIAVAACGWIAVHGLSSARATAGLLPRTTLPWDADALPEGTPDGRVLARRPTDERARLRDLVRRSASPDGAAFRTAAEGVRRWCRADPEGLLLGATAALARHRESGSPEDRRAGEDLLLEFLRRTPAGHDAAGRVLREALGPDADARVLAADLPPGLAAWVGHAFAADAPDVAWDLVAPALADPATLDERHARLVLALAAGRRDAGTTAAVERLARRPDLPEDLRREAEAALAARRGGPR
jgi:hypothetical protein